MSKTSRMWGGRILVICVLVFTTAGCTIGRDPACGGGRATRPEVIHTPDLFGVVPAEPTLWYGATFPQRTRLTVGRRTLGIDDQTRFLNGDCDRTKACLLFVGLRADNRTIDWAFAVRDVGIRDPGGYDSAVTANGFDVTDHDIVLAAGKGDEGVRLALDPIFTVAGCESGTNEDDDAERAGSFTFESATGEVVSASCLVCD